MSERVARATSGMPGPWQFQSILAALVVVDVASRALTSDSVVATWWPLLGLALLGAALVVVLPPARARMGHTTAVAVAASLDLAALGLLRLTPATGGSSVLVVLPAIWLGWVFGGRGAIAAASGVVGRVTWSV